MGNNLIVIIFWITISGSLSITWSSSINSLFARNSRQTEIGINKDLLESVGNGVQMALDHCQAKFKWDRWNCPESAFSSRATMPLTREISFTQALKSASIIFAVTKNCSQGHFAHCGCDTTYKGGGGFINITEEQSQRNNGYLNSGNKEEGQWTWGGCSDSLEYGQKVAEKVLDDGKNDWKAVVDKHNYEVGKIIVQATMQKHCRCHGVSGSCSLQTCWMQMAPFSKITDELRTKYEKAHKVGRDKKVNSVGDFGIIKDTFHKELVYLRDSPNYCKVNLYAGWNGTYGRSCSRNKGETITPAERKSCKNLCRSCGHRVRRERRRVTRRCNCAFTWCCEVRCDTCTDVVDEYFCE